MSKTNKASAASAYAGLGAALGGKDALGGLMGDQSDETPTLVAMEDIDPPGPQVRTEFEDEDNTEEEFDASVREHGILQSLLLRIMPNGRFRIVAGERRWRSANRLGLTHVPALLRELTDAQVEAMQMAENIQRKNLTQFELAKRLQRDLDELGSVEAVMEKHHKGRAWVSKILALNKIEDGQQAHRLVSERLSADLEVINAVRTIEKLDPAAAKAVVDELAQGGGKVNARDVVSQAKDKVKPPKKAKGGASAGADDNSPGSDKAPPAGKPDGQAGKQPKRGEAANQVAAGEDDVAKGLLDRAYSNITEFGADPKMVCDAMTPAEVEACEAWLQGFFEKGVGAANVSRTVFLALRDGVFATSGAGAFAMSAYLDGTDLNAQFKLASVLASVKV